MWFKKKSVLLAEGNYNTEKSVDGTDWRINGNGNSWPISNALPSAADANKYFYLPALGVYIDGRLQDIGYCKYWSSSGYPSFSGWAYYLYIGSHTVAVDSYYRYRGFRGDWFD